MIDRLLLLFDCAAEEAVDRIAVAAGWAKAPDQHVRVVLDEFCTHDSRWRLLTADDKSHASAGRFLGLLREMPDSLQPFVVAFVNSEAEVSEVRANTGVDDVFPLSSSPSELARALKPVRRFLQLQTLYRRHAFNDPLTGVLNRRAVLDLLSRELKRASRLQYPVSLAMIDIDQYKEANEALGHIGGDAAMVSLTARIASQLRPYDALGRYGGDEFLLVLSNCEIMQARIICERIRTAVAATPVSAGGQTFPLTVSIGLTCAPALDTATDCDLIQRADLALYEAKHTGRNRVVVSS